MHVIAYMCDKKDEIMLKEYIATRKSTRKYDLTPLDKPTLQKIEEFATNLQPLYEDIEVEYSFVQPQDVKNLIPVKAPHYILISSEPSDGYLMNVGFLFQQMDLYLSSLNLGSCWLGLARPTDKNDSTLEFVIALAFGKALDSPHREQFQFRRKPLSKISNISDERVESARLAPSSTNSQPWYFVTDKDYIHAYCVKVGLLKGLVYNKMNQIDMGIALSHLYVSNKSTYSFTTLKEVKEISGYYYVGSVKID